VLSGIFGLLTRIVRGFLDNPLATIVFAVAWFGGVAVSDSWVGHLIGGIVNIGPWYLPHLLFAAAVFVIGCDLFRDGVAERFAIYLVLVAPSLAMAIPQDAKLHTLLAGWITDLNDWATREIGPWITGSAKGNATLTGIGMIAVVIAVVWCERFAKNGSQQMSGTNGTPGASPVPATSAPTPVRRRR